MNRVVVAVSWLPLDVTARLAQSRWFIPGVVGLALLVGLIAGASSDIAFGVATGPFILALFFTVVWRRVQRHPRREELEPVVLWGLFARVLAVAAHVVIGFGFYQGQVDYVGYLTLGEDLVKNRVLGLDPRLFNVEWLREQYLLLSGFFVVVLVTIMALPVGLTATGSLIVGAGVSLVGTYLFMRAFEETTVDVERRRFVTRALFLLPSTAYWSIFVGKDVTIFFFLGWLAYALARLLKHFTLSGLFCLGVSFAGVLTIRPHIGITIGFACAVALVLRPVRWEGPIGYLRPAYRLALAAVLVLFYYQVSAGALVWAGVQSMTVDAVAERVYQQHVGFASTQGGSRMSVALTGTSPTEIAMFLPFGIFTLLFRPGLWDIHNPLAALAAVENTYLMWLVLRRWRNFAGSLWRLRQEPFLAFALIACLTSSVVLCFEWNLGAANRHRTMVMPFLLMLLGGPALTRKSAAPAPA